MLRLERGQGLIRLTEVVAVGDLSVGQIDIVNGAGTLEAEVDADDLGVADMPGDGVSELVVDEDSGVAAVGLDAQLDELVKVDAKIGKVFSFSRRIEIGEVEVHVGDAAFCAEGDPDGRAFAEEVDVGRLAGRGAFGVIISDGRLERKMIGVDLAEVADVCEHDGRGGRLHGDILFADLVKGQADLAIVDGFFLLKIDGYGVLFDQWKPAVGLDEEVVSPDDMVADLEGGVVVVGVIIDGGILMAGLCHFYPAGGVPGLLDDDGVVRASAGVVVKDDRVRETGRADFLAAEGIVLGLRGRLLAVEEEEERQDQDEDGRTQPDAPELTVAGSGGLCRVALRGSIGLAVGAVQCGFGGVLGAFG